MTDIKNIKILYAEDNISVVSFVKVLFKKMKLTDITFAKNGKEALDIYKKNAFDIVISDVMMPIMNGFELIESIKQINKEQIFIMVTALEDKEDLIKAIRLRVNFFIEKPIDPNEFQKVLEESFGLLAQREQLKHYSELLKIELDTTTKQKDEKVHLLTEYEKAIDCATTFTRTDLQGQIIYVNDTFIQLNGFTKEEVLGKTHKILRDPDMPSSVFKELWETIQSKKIWKGIISNITKDKKKLYLDTTIIPIIDINGNLVEYMGIRHDITQIVMLQKEIEDTQKEVVFTMGAIGETRSKETGNHVKRVAEYSYLLALLAGLDEKEAQLIKMASPMHDIGKVGIPDHILNKPARLTKEEFEIMKTHAKLGYEMLKGSPRDILKASAFIAYQHHERWDGGGYPQGLSGENIHIYGRIAAICDVFDALGSDRCYKQAWSLEKILNLFKVESGKQFDPHLMKLFLDNLDRFLEISEKYKDNKEK